MIKIKNFSNCSLKSALGDLSIRNDKDKYNELNAIVKGFFKIFDLNKDDIFCVDDLFEQAINEVKLKTREMEMKEELILLKLQLNRFLSYQLHCGEVLVSKDIKGVVAFAGKTFEVAVDFVFKGLDGHGPYYRYVNLFRSKPFLKVRKSKTSTYVGESLELLMLQLFGESEHPGARVIPAYYHLKNSNDSGFSLTHDFEKGNVRSFSFDTDAGSPMMEHMSNLANVIQVSNKVFDSNCDKNLCKDCFYDRICNYEKPVPYVNENKKKEKLVPKAGISLSPNQLKAVEQNSGVLRINAGAGSGKTTLIVEKVIYLYESGVNPEDILLITFSNKGAQEIKERLEARFLGEGYSDERLDKVKIFTFNALGGALIAENYKLLGYESEPILADKVDRYDIIHDLLERREKIEGFDYRNPLMTLPGSKGVVVLFDDLISKYMSRTYSSVSEFAFEVNSDITLGKFVSLTEDTASAVIDFFYDYKDEFANRNYIQYQDQINLTIDLFRAYPDVLDRWAVEHIMIDESQDTDGKQLEVIKLLYAHSKAKSLCVVGDDSQSIYSWRYTDANIIINFNQIFKESKDVFLVDNYRSTPEIIHTANSLNRLNEKRVDKNLISKKANGRKPVLFKALTPESEYGYIAENIKNMISSGRAPSDIAIITREKKELLNIQEHLNMYEIPSVMQAPLKYIDHTHVQVISSLSAYLYNAKNEQSLLEYLVSTHGEAIKQMTEMELVEFVLKEKVKLYLEFRFLSEHEKKKHFLRKIQPLIEGDMVMENFEKIIKNRKGNFKQLMKYLMNVVRYKSEITIDAGDTCSDGVVLITAHSSKGKEFPVVFVSFDKFKLHKLSYTKFQDALEEERRLMFVAITRAKEELIMSYNEKSVPLPKVHEPEIVQDVYMRELVGVNKVVETKKDIA